MNSAIRGWLMFAWPLVCMCQAVGEACAMSTVHSLMLETRVDVHCRSADQQSNAFPTRGRRPPAPWRPGLCLSCFYAYLVVIAERGVRIRVGCGLPRVQEVFEEKTKWNRELWPDRRQLGLAAWVRGGDG